MLPPGWVIVMVIKKAHGVLHMEKVPGCGWALHSILVDDGYRGQGIGSSMLREALSRCGRPVYLFATNELGGDLKRLRKFYRRFGFVPYKKNDMFPYRFNMILEKYSSD